MGSDAKKTWGSLVLVTHLYEVPSLAAPAAGRVRREFRSTTYRDPGARTETNTVPWWDEPPGPARCGDNGDGAGSGSFF
jgi:hypothetical protein